MNRFTRPYALLGGAVSAIALTAAMTVPAQASAATGWNVAFQDQYGAASNYSDYFSVVAPSNDNIWAFGTTNAAEAGLPAAEHYTGGQWQPVTLPSGLGDSVLYAASASSADNIWAVSENGLYTLEWNGSQWSVAHTWQDTGAQITGVTALSPTNVWVWGAGGYTGGIGTWHFNGTTWTEVGGAAAGIDTASAVSASNIWAIGSDGDNPQDAIVHYSNRSWHPVSSPALDNAMFNGVLAVSKTDVWVAGEASSAKTSPVLAQFNGTAWASVTVPWKVQLDRITSDGAGGLWFTANPAKSPGTTWLLHRSASGKWTKTVIDPAGSSVFGLSLVAGTTSVVGAGNVATTQGSAAAVYLHGTLGS